MKKLFFIIISSLFVFSSYSFAGEEAEQTPDQRTVDFNFILGSKGVYSSGISDSYTYNRTDVAGKLKSTYLDLSAYVRRFFNCQLTDGNGVYEYRSFNEAGISMETHIFSILNLTGEYTHSDDFNNLKRNIYYGEIELEFNRVILTADYSHENFEYKIAFNTINTKKHDYSFAMEFKPADAFSTDISYKYSNVYFVSLGYYNKNIFRAGFTVTPANCLLLMAGASGGKDSEDYTIYGADCGITFIFYSRLKLFFVYNYAYYNPAQSESTGSSGGGQGGHGPGSGNPYLAANMAGKPYSSHVVTFGMSVTF